MKYINILQDDSIKKQIKIDLCETNNSSDSNNLINQYIDPINNDIKIFNSQESKDTSDSNPINSLACKNINNAKLD